MMFMIAQQALSNNVQVSNVRLTNQNTTDDFTMVEFDIIWENSWRYNGGPNNWDAAWIFVKYKIGANGAWNHAWLNNTGHVTCASTTVTSGFLNPGMAFNITTNPALGVFLYRGVAGSGNFDCQNVQLRWNYGANNVSDDQQVDIKVFAIEHVHIPTNSFYIGSGGTESGAFYKYPNSTDPYHVQSEGAITVGTNPDNLYYPNTSGTSGDRLGPIPLNFPKGFSAFYVMKYEISQKGYVDFLNTLTRQQQISRVRSNISSTNVTSTYVMSMSSTITYRSVIRCRSVLPPSPAPVYFYCDMNLNNIADEAGDGLNIACNYLTWSDQVAYLDWSGLRPLSELEFEKSGRGNQFPSADEFAWGNNYFYRVITFTNSGFSNEIATDPFANITVNDGQNGPIRCGAFSKTTSDRTQSGAGYYGAMELSGNVTEKCVTVGNPSGRLYDGKHGDGLIDINGNANVVFWPDPVSGDGVANRGGSFYASPVGNQFDVLLSDRGFGAVFYGPGGLGDGGRGCRTAQ